MYMVANVALQNLLLAVVDRMRECVTLEGMIYGGRSVVCFTLGFCLTDVTGVWQVVSKMQDSAAVCGSCSVQWWPDY